MAKKTRNCPAARDVLTPISQHQLRVEFTSRPNVQRARAGLHPGPSYAVVQSEGSQAITEILKHKVEG